MSTADQNELIDRGFDFTIWTTPGGSIIVRQTYDTGEKVEFRLEPVQVDQFCEGLKYAKALIYEDDGYLAMKKARAA